MSISGVAIKVSVTAWDTVNQVGKTGLASSTFTLEVAADGADIGAITSSGNISEDGSGEYFVILTSAQNTGTMMSLRGSNSSTGIIIVPLKWNNLAAAPYSGTPPTTSQIAAAILVTPAHLLATDSSGNVTFNNTSIATVTTLTNLPSIPAGWLTATGIAASALNGKGDWLPIASYPPNFSTGWINSNGTTNSLSQQDLLNLNGIPGGFSATGGKTGTFAPLGSISNGFLVFLLAGAAATSLSYNGTNWQIADGTHTWIGPITDTISGAVGTYAVGGQANIVVAAISSIIGVNLPPNFSTGWINSGGVVQSQLANGVAHGGDTATMGLASLELIGSSSEPIVNIQNNGIGAALRINAADGSNYAMILTGGSAGTVGLFNEGGPVFDFQGAGDLLNLACGGSNAIPVTDPNGTDPPGTEAIADADLPTAPEIDTELSTTHGSGAWGGGSGGGATPAQIWTYTPRTLTGPNNVTVVISNPVAQNKNLQITQGDAYDTLTNQPIVFYDNGTWPVMTNGSTQLATVEIKLSIAQSSLLTNIVLSIMGSVTGASPNQVATFTPTATQTQALTPGADYSNDVRASMNYPTNTEIRELVTGSTQVNAPITTEF